MKTQNHNSVKDQNANCDNNVLVDVVIRKAIDIRKEVFYFILNNDDFIIDDLFLMIDAKKEKEKVHVYNYLKELCYFNFIQAIKSRYLKVKI